MTKLPTRRRLFLSILATAAALSLASCAAPTPTANAQADAPISAVDLATGEQDGPVEVSVDDGGEGVGVTFREITIKPGATTGVHCHYGQLVAVVEQGSLTHYADIYEGGVAVYDAGDAIIEGAGYPHEGRNEGTTDVVLLVTYIIPEGKPLAETALENCD